MESAPRALGVSPEVLSAGGVAVEGGGVREGALRGGRGQDTVGEAASHTARVIPTRMARQRCL